MGWAVNACDSEFYFFIFFFIQLHRRSLTRICGSVTTLRCPHVPVGSSYHQEGKCHWHRSLCEWCALMWIFSKVSYVFVYVNFLSLTMHFSTCVSCTEQPKRKYNAILLKFGQFLIKINISFVMSRTILWVEKTIPLPKSKNKYMERCLVSHCTLVFL